MDRLKATESKILLASNSPRRRELLKMIAPDFIIAKMHDIDESYPHDLPAEKVPAFLSQLKSAAYRSQLEPDEILLTADTVVIDKGKIIGKPKSPENAVEILTSLMGHKHTVVTGVTLASIEKAVTFSESTDVTFDNLSEEEIRDYVSKYSPMDKAGAYGIQEWIGCVGIKGIEGCFYNVMGLPLHTLYRHLQLFNSSITGKK